MLPGSGSGAARGLEQAPGPGPEPGPQEGVTGSPLGLGPALASQGGSEDFSFLATGEFFYHYRPLGSVYWD